MKQTNINHSTGRRTEPPQGTAELCHTIRAGIPPAFSRFAMLCVGFSLSLHLPVGCIRLLCSLSPSFLPIFSFLFRASLCCYIFTMRYARACTLVFELLV